MRKEVECQLVIAGGFASDDPEGERVLTSLHHKTRGMENVHILRLSLADRAQNWMEVNALQRAATVLMQPSTKEGFGLVVTEGLWKSKPVIGADVGGISLQIRNGDTGFFYQTPRKTATTVIDLLRNPSAAEMVGRRAKAFVQERFLMPDRVADNLIAIDMSINSAGSKKIPTGSIISFHPWTTADSAAMTSGLDGRVALVTGAAGGIGSSIARALAEHGAQVLVHDLREDAQKVADEVGGTYLQADLSDMEETRALSNQALARSGRVDILVNNAGLQAHRSRRRVPRGCMGQAGPGHARGAVPAHEASASGDEGARLGADHKHVLYPRTGREPVQVGLRRGKARPYRPDQDRRTRGRAVRRHRKRHLPRICPDAACRGPDRRSGPQPRDPGARGGRPRNAGASRDQTPHRAGRGGAPGAVPRLRGKPFHHRARHTASTRAGPHGRLTPEADSLRVAVGG